MIIELIAIVVIGGMAGMAVYGLVLQWAKGRAVAEKRLFGNLNQKKEASKDPLYEIGGRLLEILPARWLEILKSRFGAEAEIKLAAAGMDIEVAAYMGARIILGVFGFAAGLAVFGTGMFGIACAAGLALMCQRWPSMQLRARAEALRMEFVRLLPDFIEMLAIGAGAGLSLDRGIRLYCDRFDNRLAEAFSVTMNEIELGKRRKQSFQELADRNRHESLTWFVSSVMQAEKLGSPLVQTLKEQAKAGRERQTELVEELSTTAPIKMLFPIAGLILPALFIVVLGPAFLQFMQ